MTTINRKSLEEAYVNQKSSAKHRGISFDLTFDEWLDIWGDKIHLRGTGRDKLCMSRIGDKNGYSVGNVRIISNRENYEEYLNNENRKPLNRTHTGKTTYYTFDGKEFATKKDIMKKESLTEFKLKKMSDMGLVKKYRRGAKRKTYVTPYGAFSKFCDCLSAVRENEHPNMPRQSLWDRFNKIKKYSDLYYVVVEQEQDLLIK